MTSVGAMDSVFVSSIQRNFEDVRSAAADAIDSYGLHPVTAETTGASPDSPQRALLDEVRDAEIFLLILGPVYGERGASGFSPTEDEYNEAVRLGRPVLVLEQSIDFESAQDEFRARVRGGWEEGRLTGRFESAADIGLAVIRALKTLEGGRRPLTQEELGAAFEKVVDLAAGSGTRGYVASGSKARVVIAPSRQATVLDAEDLDDDGLIDRILGMTRTSGLTSNAMAITQSVSSEGVEFVAKAEGAWEELQFRVGADGSIVSEGAVGGEAAHFGSGVVMANGLKSLIEKTQTFALAVWHEIDKGHDIRYAMAIVAVPDAQHKLFAETEPGNSMSVPMGLPAVVLAPNPPRQVRREDLGSEALTRSLLAETKRKFADANAVHS